MDRYNLTINFNQEHLKSIFYVNLSTAHFREEKEGLSVYPDLFTSVFFPWSSIHYLRKEKVKEE